MDKEYNIESQLQGLDYLEKSWNEGKGEITPDTFRQFSMLGGRIRTAEKKRRNWIAVMWTFSVAAMLVAVAGITFNIASNEFSVSPLEGTRTLLAGYGQVSSIILDDGTKVILNAGSSLLYPESFNNSSRIVYLTGEANFSVAKDPDRPFIVKTDYLDVQALGTVFGVHSFPGEAKVSATLKEGKIKVSIPSASSESYFLDPDTQLVFSPYEHKVKLASVDAGKILEWEEGKLNFINANCAEVFSTLERRFNVIINYNGGMQHNSLNVRFMPEESLEDALDILKLLVPGSTYRREGDRIYWQF